MINRILIMIISLLIVSCSSVDVKSIEELDKKNMELSSKLDKIEKEISLKNIKLNSGSDLNLKISNLFLNRVLEKFTLHKNDDVILDFWYSPKIINEESSFAGIKYTNYLDIEGGKISLDLKNLKFDKINNNVIDGVIELFGNGNVSISGKYLGLPGKASPNLQLNLNEKISFNLNSQNSNLTLKVIPKQIILKTRTSISLLKWELPWNQDVPLELSQLLQPINLPLGLESEIKFPIPAQNFGSNIEYANYKLKLNQTHVTANNNKIEYKTNIEFIKK